VLLAGALMYSTLRPEFDCSNMSLAQVTPSKETFTIKFLGAGGAANVFQLGDGEFIKIPRAACVTKLWVAEAAILKKLESDQSSSFRIPRLVCGDISIIQTVIRGEISTMIGLRLRGIIGVPLENLLRADCSEHATEIVATVFEALTFAHTIPIYHIDVKPGNIIVSIIEGKCCAMLSDWGCSFDGTTGNQKLDHHRGTTVYSHDRLLDRGTAFDGKVGPELDFASLAYTIDHVQYGKVRWRQDFNDAGHDYISETDELKNRRQFVSEWLQDAEETDKLPPSNLIMLSGEIRSVLKNAIYPACN
jgi:serine/threonine protein kinase